jgi:hypothetical protein
VVFRLAILRYFVWQSCGISFGNLVVFRLAILWYFIWQSCGISFGNLVVVHMSACGYNGQRTEKKAEFPKWQQL